MGHPTDCHDVVTKPSHRISRCPRCDGRVFCELELEHGDYEITCIAGHLIAYVDLEGRLTLVGRTADCPVSSHA